MRERRGALLADRALVGAPLRRALVALYDEELSALLGDPGPGVALVAVGSLGRREPSPGSDLDLVLLHDDDRDVAPLAEALWYPLWDSGVGLDHSVRTVAQALAVAATDLKAALGLLDARHVAGDSELSARLVAAARAAWRSDVRRRLPELLAAVQERARTAGEVAFLLEPDLKQARGGLRDVHALQALAVAQVADSPSEAVRRGYELLLDVRAELHRRHALAGRQLVDRLLLQEQDAVAAALAFADADVLMSAVSGAARTIAYASDITWRRTPLSAPVPGRRWLPGRRHSAGRVAGSGQRVRRPLADGVVEQGGEVVLSRDVVPGNDATLPLRVARAAAVAGLPIAPHTLDRLVEHCPALPVPWPRAALDALVGLLAAGPASVAVIEALDQAGLLVAMLPEWKHVRSRPQRNSYHRFTVDRHLVEAAAAAAALTRQVSRPDLLLLGAFLHDIGKGLPGDHTEVGMVLVARIGPRLGLSAEDTAVLVTLVRYHLLLPDVATRRDLDDPETILAVAGAVGTVEVLELLRALTHADSQATGPAAWSTWKAGLVDQLAARTSALLAGTPLQPPAPLAPWQQAVVADGVLALRAREDEVTVVAPDRPGVLALAAGVIALHRLDVRSASACSVGEMGVAVLRVSPRFGSMPDWMVVNQDLRRAAEGDLDLPAVLARREQAYAPRDRTRAAPSQVRLIDDASSQATVVEVRAADGIGVLFRIASALNSQGLDVRSAHICSLGADVIDAFYVVGPDGGTLTDDALRRRVCQQVRAVLDH